MKTSQHSRLGNVFAFALDLSDELVGLLLLLTVGGWITPQMAGQARAGSVAALRPGAEPAVCSG